MGRSGSPGSRRGQCPIWEAPQCGQATWSDSSMRSSTKGIPRSGRPDRRRSPATGRSRRGSATISRPLASRTSPARSGRTGAGSGRPGTLGGGVGRAGRRRPRGCGVGKHRPGCGRGRRPAAFWSRPVMKGVWSPRRIGRPAMPSAPRAAGLGQGRRPSSAEATDGRGPPAGPARATPDPARTPAAISGTCPGSARRSGRRRGRSEGGDRSAEAVAARGRGFGECALRLGPVALTPSPDQVGGPGGHVGADVPVDRQPRTGGRRS